MTVLNVVAEITVETTV